MATTQTSALTRMPLWGKVFVGAAMCLITAGAYWFIFFTDIGGKIEGAERQKKTLRDELAQQQQSEASYFADRDELALREQRARELNKLLPPESETDAFLSSVQTSANSAGIDLQGYAPLDEVAQTFYAKVPMKLDMSGKFHQIAKFAFELGKSDRIINVENIELTDPKIVGDEVILKGHCLATAFRAIKPKEAPRGPGAPGTPGAAPGTPGAATGAPPAPGAPTGGAK
jgi:type IV pilus assembly protein PilO